MALDPKYAKELQEALDAQPPLSWLDRGIWLAGAAAGFAATAGLYVLLFSRMNAVREVNPEAVAVGETSAIFWGIPGVVFPFLIGLFCLCSLYYKIALFGRRDTVYSGSTHRDLMGYPLFMNLKEARSRSANGSGRTARSGSMWASPWRCSWFCSPGAATDGRWSCPMEACRSTASRAV